LRVRHSCREAEHNAGADQDDHDLRVSPLAYIDDMEKRQ
jgi:hypothetical protein